MTLKVQLLVSEWCAPCRGAEEVWREAAQRRNFMFEVLDVGQPEGRAIVARHAIKTVPASVVDDTLKHVGVPTLAQALGLVAAAPERTTRGVDYVGLTLRPSARWALAGAALYLALSGAGLLAGGGIGGDSPWRSAGLHLFGLGFVGFAIFGFGEHMVPRFVGAPIRGGAYAWVQQVLAHAGLLTMAAGLSLGEHAVALAGGLLAWSGFVVFAVRLWPVLAGARASSTRPGQHFPR